MKKELITTMFYLKMRIFYHSFMSGLGNRMSWMTTSALQYLDVPYIEMES